nr:hypothetical protein Iba_chr05bCG8860 [Ipomoea batatas]
MFSTARRKFHLWRVARRDLSRTRNSGGCAGAGLLSCAVRGLTRERFPFFDRRGAELLYEISMSAAAQLATVARMFTILGSGTVAGGIYANSPGDCPGVMYSGWRQEYGAAGLEEPAGGSLCRKGLGVRRVSEAANAFTGSGVWKGRQRQGGRATRWKGCTVELRRHGQLRHSGGRRKEWAAVVLERGGVAVKHSSWEHFYPGGRAEKNKSETILVVTDRQEERGGGWTTDSTLVAGSGGGNGSVNGGGG